MTDQSWVAVSKFSSVASPVVPGVTLMAVQDTAQYEGVTEKSLSKGNDRPAAVMVYSQLWLVAEVIVADKQGSTSVMSTEKAVSGLFTPVGRSAE